MNNFKMYVENLRSVSTHVILSTLNQEVYDSGFTTDSKSHKTLVSRRYILYSSKLKHTVLSGMDLEFTASAVGLSGERPLLYSVCCNFVSSEIRPRSFYPEVGNATHPAGMSAENLPSGESG